MKEVTFNRNSWHGQLAYFYGSLESWDSETDICTYIRSCVSGVIKILLFMALGTLTILWPTGDFLAWLVVGIAGTFTAPGVGTTVFLAVMIGIPTAVCLIWAIEKFQERAYQWRNRKSEASKSEAKKPDGFLANAYDSIKGKYCFKVKVVNDTETPENTDAESEAY